MSYSDIGEKRINVGKEGVSLWEVTPVTMTPYGLTTIYHTQDFSVYQKPAADVVKNYFWQ
jgi:hypothetical protein